MIESDEMTQPAAVMISRNDLLAAGGSAVLADARYHEIVAGVQVRAMVLLASAGSVRRVDAWSAAAGLVLHAFVEDLDTPSGATLATGALATAALAHLVGSESRSPSSTAAPAEFPNADALIEGVARGSVTGPPGTSATAVVVGIHEVGGDGTRSVALLHAGSTLWCVHDPGGPVALHAGDFVGLWSALSPILRPIN